MTGRGPGFTVIELALVITLICILAWVAYPRFASVYEVKLDAAAGRVAADLRYAQSRSIGTRTMHGILFEPSRAKYTVFAPAPGMPVSDPADPGRTLQVDFARKTEFQGVSIASAAFGSTSGVKFDFFGVPLDTAGAELSVPGRVVLLYQGHADTVEVSPGTGAVSVR